MTTEPFRDGVADYLRGLQDRISAALEELDGAGRFREDVIHFHRVWQAVCRRHAPLVDYARLKRWCDEYFYLPHRGETRGVGGIFFDYLEGDPADTFAFVRDCGDAFPEAYLPIARR